MSKLAKQIGDRLKEAGGAKDAHELDLSNLSLTEISKDTKKTIEKAKSIEMLILSENELTTIEGLPEWELVGFDISSNKYPFFHPGSPMLLLLAFLASQQSCSLISQTIRSKRWRPSPLSSPCLWKSSTFWETQSLNCPTIAPTSSKSTTISTQNSHSQGS
jgi:hypothetical protein